MGRTIDRWNSYTGQYEPVQVPNNWKIALYSDNMDEQINCVNCGKPMTYGEGYTSRRYHNPAGMGYMECEECYYDQLNEEGQLGASGIEASTDIVAERCDYSDGEHIGQPLANKEIQVKQNGRWIRYTTTWPEYVDIHIQDARDRGYDEVRVINCATSRKFRKITAADDEFEDPRVTEAEDLQDKVSEDFDYVMAGIERLQREGLLDEAISLLNTLSDTFDSAIGIIGDDFESGEGSEEGI